MASFYDTVNDSDLKRVEELLKKGGIVYTLRGIGAGTALKEIQVSEEDLAAAEEILCSPPHADN
jgi:DNA-binding IscR family transcriptional regulator